MQNQGKYRHQANDLLAVKLGKLVFGFVFLGFQSVACSTAMAVEPPVYTVMRSSPVSDAGGITLQVDGNGHFTGTVLINDFPMPFLIDTGATYTSIPSKLAVSAHLPLGKQVETSTASGRSFDKLTTVKSMKIGTAEIKNIDAMINSHLTEVLIGMNTLKYFHMQQSAGKLTLAINSAMLEKTGKDNAVSVEKLMDVQEQTKPGNVIDNSPSRPIKMSVVCDEKKHCITQFHNE